MVLVSLDPASTLLEMVEATGNTWHQRPGGRLGSDRRAAIRDQGPGAVHRCVSWTRAHERRGWTGSLAAGVLWSPTSSRAATTASRWATPSGGGLTPSR
ncbi:hypothetical protein HBB16_11730 [Pseudonocardia sp. MCCB 268]|nr:hypothetical protein [Pseudonocardia cytotoxica]